VEILAYWVVQWEARLIRNRSVASIHFTEEVTLPIVLSWFQEQIQA